MNPSGRNALKLPVAAFVLVGICFLCPPNSWLANLAIQVAESARAKQWVLSSHAPKKGISVIIGNREKIIYEPSEANIGFAYRSVSPRGKKVAFVETRGDRFTTPVTLKVGTINIDGSHYAALFDVSDTWEDIAWSFDEKMLAFIAASEEDSYSLIVLDLNSQRPVYKKAFTSGLNHLGLTTQAWSPDNHHLVFVDSRGHITILNLKTKSEEDIGPGETATWSRDGRFIAYRAKSPHARPGDYFITDAAKPRSSKTLLLNTSLCWYLGAPLWSPNDRFILIMRSVENEYHQPTIIDVKTGASEALPIGSMGDMRSWGGLP
jgi:Tol biopolymer transport system component